MGLSPEGIWLLGGMLGLILGLFKWSWWWVALVGLAAMVTNALLWAPPHGLMSGLVTATKEPAWLFVGIAFSSIPALIGWGLGRLLHTLGGK